MERKLTRVDTKRLPLRSSGNLLRGGAGSAGPSYAGAHMPNLADFDDDELDWD